MYDIMHLPGVIELGYTGENDFRPIAFDMRPWLQKMPDGVPSIIHIRPGETASEAYVCATEFEDGILTWKPVLGDLGEVEGYGQAQIWMEEILTDGTRRGKSAKFQTFVQGAVNEASSDVPEAQEAWITQMTGLKDATVLAKNAAVAAQTGAETAEENAEAWAVGQRNGVDVGSTDPTYHNNSKYYSGQAAGSATDANTAKGDAVSAKDDAVLAKTAAEAAQDAAQAASLHYPYVDPTTGDWMKWDVSQNAFVDTGVHAKGDTGTVPDIEIGTVTTVEHDVPASVTRRAGSPDEAPIFDFSIPKGETGTAENIYGTTIPMSTSDATKVATAIGGKTDMVANATAGNFAGLDSSGNLTDSGHKHSDYVEGTDFFATEMPVSDQDSTKVSTALSSINGLIGTVPSGATLQDEIVALNARVDALDPDKGVGIFADFSLSIPSSSWTLSNNLYTYTYANLAITQRAGVEVFYDMSYRTALAGDIYYTKNTGSITFTTTKAPIGTLTGTVRVIDSVQGVVPVDHGGTGANTAADAREALNIYANTVEMSSSDSTTVSSAISTLNNKITNRAFNVYASIASSGDAVNRLKTGWDTLWTNAKTATGTDSGIIALSGTIDFPANGNNAGIGTYYFHGDINLSNKAGIIYLNQYHNDAPFYVVLRHPDGTYNDDQMVRKSEIGIISTVDNTVSSLASSTWTTVSTLTLGIGVYVITGDLWFTGNSNGIRILILDLEETPTNSYDNSVLGTGRADLNKTRILNLTSQTTMYLRAYQSSGTGLETKGRIRAVMIK